MDWVKGLRERTQGCQGSAQATGKMELLFTEMRKAVGGNQELDFGHAGFEMPIQVDIQVWSGGDTN